MSVVHVRRLRAKIERDFRALIDLSDVAGRPDRDREDILLTRGLAAFALSKIADIDAEAAASSIVDGFQDNGIDAIWYDAREHHVYVVQSKWMHSGSGSPELGDILKFIEGFRSLLVMDLSCFNSKFKSRAENLKTALNDERAHFVVALAYTGKDPISNDARRHLDELLQECNDIDEIVAWRSLGLKELHGLVLGEAEGASIDVEVMIREWGQIREPYRAVCGQVHALEIAKWYQTHGSRLFSKNLRKVIQGSGVNQQISDTLRHKPQEFWYLNNGITALCQRMRKKPLGGPDRSGSVFVVEGMSIVNGAQTVGSIAATAAQVGEQLSQALVLARFISLEQCPDGFATQVTRATNTQNRIDSKDFAALDPEQERLRQELLADGKVYAYKTGDSQPARDNGCTIDEATVALACSNRDLSLATIAKAAVGKLWEDITRPPYKLLFHDRLMGIRLWRCVELLRVIDDTLHSQGILLGSSALPISVHGNRFIAHVTFSRLPTSDFDKPDFDLANCRAQAQMIATSVLKSVADTMSERFSGAYLQMFFKNASRCRQLAATLGMKLPQQTTLFGGEPETIEPRQGSLFDDID